MAAINNGECIVLFVHPSLGGAKLDGDDWQQFVNLNPCCSRRGPQILLFV